MLRGLLAGVAGLTALAGSALAEDAHLRIVDVGAGLCVIATTPDGYDFLYDAGHWTSRECAAAIAELVTDGELELVVISHSDSDHLGELPEILEATKAGVIIHTGYRREGTINWEEANTAIAAEADTDGASVINLQTWPLVPGSIFHLGDATATFVAGWHTWDMALSGSGRLAPSASERRNANSIVMRFDYGGHSVLLAGDTIGRRLHREEPADACRDAERWMVEDSDPALLESDVLVASHHGGNNGSATCFIEAVDPEFVIFSAGHDHGHPRRETTERFLDHGVELEAIFRTDLGDHEASEPEEWTEGRIEGCSDPRGDDDIGVWLPSDPAEPIRVAYLGDNTGCD